MTFLSWASFVWSLLLNILLRKNLVSYIPYRGLQEDSSRKKFVAYIVYHRLQFSTVANSQHCAPHAILWCFCDHFGFISCCCCCCCCCCCGLCCLWHWSSSGHTPCWASHCYKNTSSITTGTQLCPTQSFSRHTPFSNNCCRSQLFPRNLLHCIKPTTKKPVTSSLLSTTACAVLCVKLTAPSLLSTTALERCCVWSWQLVFKVRLHSKNPSHQTHNKKTSHVLVAISSLSTTCTNLCIRVTPTTLSSVLA